MQSKTGLTIVALLRRRGEERRGQQQGQFSISVQVLSQSSHGEDKVEWGKEKGGDGRTEGVQSSL